MSAADLLEDGFPHSTAEGYRAGCQGRSCPGVVDNGISCAEAFARYHGDYGFRKKVDAGMSPKEIVVTERAGSEKLNAKPKPRPLQKPTAEPLSEEAQAEVEAAVAEVVDEPSAKEIPMEKHGTTKGYYLGCRMKDTCPGIERVGKSCNQAVNEYQKTVKENRKKREAAAAKAWAAGTVTATGHADSTEALPDGALRAIADHRLVGVDADGEVCSCGHRAGSLVEHLAVVTLGAPSAGSEPKNGREADAAGAAGSEIPSDDRTDELEVLRLRIAELEQLLATGQGAPAAVTTLADGTRVTVVITVERAA